MPSSVRPTKATLAGVAIFVAVGLALVAFRVGNPLARLSYDLTFRFAHPYAPPEAVMVTIDDESRKELGIPAGRPVSRALQAKLLDRLTRDGARIVFYDLIFDAPSENPAEDEAFAAAMKKHGSVVLSGLHDTVVRAGAAEEIIVPPTPLLRGAARAWGLAGPLLLDPDNTVRRVGLPTTAEPLAHRLVAELAGAPTTRDASHREEMRWLNYYGPAGTIRWCSFHEALDEQMKPAEFFRGKIVCIGGKPSPVGRKFGEDEFGYPHARWGAPYIIGLEIHVTALLNLLHRAWLERLSLLIELSLVALLGIGAGVAAYGLLPMRAVFVLAGGALVIAVGSIALQIYAHLWWNWLVPVAIQFPLAAVWSTATRYASEARRRIHLRQAFSFYLSEQMADRISEGKFDLKPGGQLVEATVLFTDCKGFTAMCEEVKDPKIISNTLIAYFTVTSRQVLENDGTIIKYIGDAVYACWNAPIADPEHAIKAARAAWAISEASKQMVLGRVLTTRVGVCTGEVVAGNLGSPYRFDYTCIGEPVNFANRLEALNKQLGTSVLIADTTRRAIGERFVCRALGSFTVMGKTTPVAIHELIGPVESQSANLAWLQTWDEALRALREGDFAALQKLLRDVVWQRGGTDGPAEYYLSLVARLEKEGHLADWTGIVKLTEK